MRLNENGYVQRSIQGSSGSATTSRAVQRNWWLVKQASKNRGVVVLGVIMLPPELIGKRVRFKLEVVEDATKTKDDKEDSND